MAGQELEPEILINISFRLPQIAAMDRQDFSDKMLDILREALLLGGTTMHFSAQPYDPDEDD
jgi:hypothetical protein